MKHLFTGVAGIAIAGSIFSASPAEAQMRSPVQSGMQPQSTFTPPPGATFYRQDGTPVSREEFERNTAPNQQGRYQDTQPSHGYQQEQRSDRYQQEQRNDWYGQGYEYQQSAPRYSHRYEERSQAYREGYQAGEDEAQSRREADNYYAGRQADYQLGCASSFNGRSWTNRGLGALDRQYGRDGREIAGILGLRSGNVIADAQAQCRINQLPEGDQRDRAQGRYDRHIEERTRERIENGFSRRIFGRSP